MTIGVALLVLVMILGFSGAQYLFKRAAQSVTIEPSLQTLWALATNPSFLGALVLYGTGTLLYLWILNRLPLSRAYAFFALQFVLVPVLAVVLLGEAPSLRLFLGSALIVAGILLATQG